MDRSWDHVFRFLVAAAFLTPCVLGRPSSAGSPGPGKEARGGDAPAALFLAQANPTDTAPALQPPPSEETHGRPSHADRVETRIEDLHHNLKITAAQEPLWRDVAQVMRDNAHAIDAIRQQRSANLSHMNAVDDLRSYQKLADAHADGLKKLVPAFEALYNTMTDDQKKNADAAFGNFERRPRHSKG